MEASSGSVLADLGLPDAVDLDTKVRLAVELNRALKLRRLSQVRAAAVLGITQPKISALVNYRLDGFSVERLMRFITALGLDVEIRIKAHRAGDGAGRIVVEAA